ncbi:hypothetical protein B296_00020369 [Ensete ventricosum]|uniref:Uncharacterized protein n=1 Tax=Ensete ventricosum TaxID=4639 RepID=A0A427AA26_ENSVE|nr:hypothetical protein B296_00020369 [Ensete ventricosum]
MANALGMTSILNFQEGARKTNRNLTSCVTLRKAWKDDDRFCNRQFQAWKGSDFFSPRRGTASRARNDGGCTAIGAGFTAALRSCDKSGVERVTATSAMFSHRQLAVSRARDAMDASGQTRYSASHTAPLFQQDAPLLASSQRPPLVASQRNAPLHQPLVPSQREGVAPLQQPLDPLQQPIT